MEKTANKEYTFDMDNWSRFLDKPKDEQWSGEEIHKLLEGVHEDFEHYTKQKRKVNPTTILYYRDLLSYLIKTYGH